MSNFLDNTSSDLVLTQLAIASLGRWQAGLGNLLASRSNLCRIEKIEREETPTAGVGVFWFFKNT